MHADTSMALGPKCLFMPKFCHSQEMSGKHLHPPHCHSSPIRAQRIHNTTYTQAKCPGSCGGVDTFLISSWPLSW